jgi:superfamily II DNA or RNA helicase
MAARLIDALAQPAIYLAPSVQIVRQTHSVLVQHLGSDCVGRFDGGAALEDRNLNRPVVVATPNSALRFPAEFWDTRQLLVIDEFHHSAAEMYHAISALAKNTYYRFGFTGTHFRTGADRLAMEAVCSTTIEKITLQELIPQYIAPPRVFFMRTPGPRFVAEDFQNAYDEGIVQNEDRNTLVTKIVTQLQERGVPTIVLTRRRAHADALGARINDSLVVKGGENALTGRSVRAFLDGSCNVLIGTTVIGEGVDVPRAAALVFASGGNDGVSMLQAYFRPLTAYAGKDAGRIYDFWDRQQETLRRQSANRFKMAKTQFQSVFRVE